MVNMVNMAFSDKLDGKIAVENHRFQQPSWKHCSKKCLVVAMENLVQYMPIISK